MKGCSHLAKTIVTLSIACPEATKGRRVIRNISYHFNLFSMKRIIIIIATIIAVQSANAQFSQAVLQASGLTCAMCTKAIDNALKELPFVASVAPDIKNSAFTITFKEGVHADVVDALRKAVEDAGFFVARLKIKGRFNNVAIKNDEHVAINGSTFHFLHVNSQVLNGDKELTIVDKNFLTPKEFKKHSSATAMQCIQTGKAAGCCDKAGVTPGTRIYHVTI
jgi:copper chaperone CopZ